MRYATSTPTRLSNDTSSRDTERKLDEPEIDGQWPKRRRDAGGEELLRRPGGKQDAGRLLHDAPDDKSDREDQSMKPRPVLG